MCLSEVSTGYSEVNNTAEPCPQGVASPTRKICFKHVNNSVRGVYGKDKGLPKSKGQGNDVGGNIQTVIT